MNKKQLIRQEMKQQLAQLARPEYEDKSYQIATSLYQDVLWKKAKTIGITISRPPEVDTMQIIRKGWEEGKRVVVPKCFPKDKKMTFRTLSRFSELESVYYGLFEPIETQTEEVVPEQIDLIVVPGLAFTMEGFRLGFGGGYYDRYLSHFKGDTIALAFLEQIRPDLPIEPHDIPVAKIISEWGNTTWD
ncbi:5-formyltetrahydrofolate cyclo-ligase [Mesobacillus harenae]|uniref:5-formyltetrahydrofolate cyclo-ligase n=1 Tax=Mesobacillus harenae TaxID=2213203 RepID=UPI0015811AB3|nr:5-formyltetrahydrofolate cyclo-ligase [Mesobacillus harenae]